MRRGRLRLRQLTFVLLVAVATLPTRSQAQQQTATAPATRPAADRPLTLDLPADGIELKTLVEVVSKRLKIPILYDDQVSNKRVIVRVPVDVPEGALLGVLNSALRMKQLALVDAEQPGWKQIVAVQNLAAAARPTTGPAAEAGAAITQVFVLKNADPARLAEVIRPMLTQPGGNVTAVGGQRALVVSDYPSAVGRVEQLVRLLDAQAPPLEARFVPLKSAEAASVATLVTQLVNNRETYQWGNPAGAGGISITADDRANQLVVVAPPDRMKDVIDLIERADAPVEARTRVYRPKAISPERLDRLIRGLLEGAARKSYQATPDREAQALVVAAPDAVHARIAELLTELDVPAAAEQSPIRFYKLKNSKAADVLATIAGLQGEAGLESFHAEEPPAEGAAGVQQLSAGAPGTPSMTPSQTSLPSTSTPAPVAPPQVQVAPPSPARVVPRELAAVRRRPDGSIVAPPGMSDIRSVEGSGSGGYTGYGDELSRYPLDYGGAPSISVQTRNATVTADANTNSIIVVAQPAVQQLYADLIRRLDQRRPQVQIECTIVTLDTSNGFSLGVDVGRSDTLDDGRVITFSSFGVSTVDPATGRLTPVRGTGGTFALLNPHVADVVIRALQTNSRARLISSPQVLVNDNGKGKLESVDQEPFAEILDTNTTQSRTGLGGQAQAGTTISIEPHISDDDYLQLTYSVELSSFTGQSSAGLPPPSQKNAVDSTVTIPDGYTIVVGGLSTKNLRETISSVPILGDIPIVGYLFGTRNRTTTDRTLFVFIRPVILRDDQFADLKYYSERNTDAAGIAGSFPKSDPIPMR